MTPINKKESVGHCFVCHTELFREDFGSWVYHSSVGAVCKKHPGVKEWYNKLLEESLKEARDSGILFEG